MVKICAYFYPNFLLLPLCDSKQNVRAVRSDGRNPAVAQSTQINANSLVGIVGMPWHQRCGSLILHALAVDRNLDSLSPTMVNS